LPDPLDPSNASFGRGRFSVPGSIKDEPLPADAPTDFGVALEIALQRKDNERERLDGIEGKIAPIIAGTIAAFALFVDKADSWLDLFAAAFYLVPLYQLFVAFRTYEYIDVPNLNELDETWQQWPQTFLRAAFKGTVNAVNRNAPMIDAKARRLNYAMTSVLWVTILVLGLRVVDATPFGQSLSHRFPYGASAQTSAVQTTPARTTPAIEGKPR
jgi:hypothetical protein